VLRRSELNDRFPGPRIQVALGRLLDLLLKAVGPLGSRGFESRPLRPEKALVSSGCPVARSVERAPVV